jgi:hypothetical protein
VSMVGTYRCEGSVGIHELHGEKTFEEAKAVWKSIAQSIKEDALKGVIVVDRTMPRLPLAEVVDMEPWFKEVGLSRTTRIAIVDAETERSDNVFGETVARNRGWPLITVFADETAARAWLGLTA